MRSKHEHNTKSDCKNEERADLSGEARCVPRSGGEALLGKVSVHIQEQEPASY